MIYASVRRVSAPARQDTMKFCVNGDWNRPMTLTHAILQAKVDCFDDLCANRPAEVAICSTETGEVLLVVRLSKNLEFRIDRPMFICNVAGEFLCSQFGIEDAISWVEENGYDVVQIDDTKLTVTKSAAWFAQ